MGEHPNLALVVQLEERLASNQEECTFKSCRGRYGSLVKLESHRSVKAQFPVQLWGGPLLRDRLIGRMAAPEVADIGSSPIPAVLWKDKPKADDGTALEMQRG